MKIHVATYLLKTLLKTVTDSMEVSEHFAKDDNWIAAYATGRETIRHMVRTIEISLESLEVDAKPDPLPGHDDLVEEWYDATGRPCANGAYDAAGHYFAERDQGIDCDED